MKPQPILFFAPADDERERICPHGKLMPMPPTREQRAAERERFHRQFNLWCAAVYVLMTAAAMAYFSLKGGK